MKARAEDSYFQHDCFSDAESVKNILDFELNETHYRKEKKNYEITPCPIIKKEFLDIMFLKYNLLKKMYLEGDSDIPYHKEVAKIIAQHNLRLISVALKNFQNRDDFLGSAYLTLLRCIDRYDFNKGISFTTYASRALYLNELRDSKGKWTIADEHAVANISVFESQEDNLVFKENQAIAHEALNVLSDKERLIITKYFGLDTEKTGLLEIGKEIGVSKERVRQLKARAIRKMRRSMGHVLAKVS